MAIKGVSIVICCHNSSTRLKSTLWHIAQQKIKPGIRCEIVIVDNASNDATAIVACREWEALNISHIDFKIVPEANPGLSYARKKGISESSYGYLIFCDDDNWLSEYYIDTVFHFFENHPQVAIIGGYGEAVFDNYTILPDWFHKFFKNYALGAQSSKLNTEMGCVYGAGMAARKAIIDKDIFNAHNFLTDRQGKNLTAGGDSEICFKVKLLGYKIAYLPELKFKHYISNDRLDWEYFKKLHIGFSKSFVVLNIYEKALNSQSSTLPPFYWLKNALYYWGIYLKYWPKHFRAYSTTIGTVDEIHHITWSTIAKSYLRYNLKTKAIYREIMSLKSSSKISEQL